MNTAVYGMVAFVIIIGGVAAIGFAVGWVIDGLVRLWERWRARRRLRYGGDGCGLCGGKHDTAFCDRWGRD